MLRKFTDSRDERSLAVQLRRKRFSLFTELLAELSKPITILDIGGTENFWRTMGVKETDKLSVTLLNPIPDPVTFPFLTSIPGDARAIDFEDQSFDVAFSNSVIEHLSGLADQMRMANEVRRVGKRYFIQTPNKYFPIEPHFLFPFFQFLPLAIRASLIHRFNLGWVHRRPDAKRARETVESIRLLSKRQFKKLFPTAQIYQEKFLGMTKSFVAYEGWNVDRK